MPQIKLTAVKGFSNKDDKYPAENLLTGGKWLLSSKISTTLSATFQLSECCTVSSIHVGNSGSAFISLQVSRTGYNELKELLPCSALMTMQESKSEQNKCSVKIFNKDSFLEETREDKWDQLRVVLTQPFNHRMIFGLCFLHVFSFTEEGDSTMKTPFDLSKWEKLKSSHNSPSQKHKQQFSSITRKDRLLLEVGQQPSKLKNKENTAKKEELKDEVDEVIFEASALSFMESLNLKDKDLDNIQLVALRMKMEKIHGKEFSPKERHIFAITVRKFLISMQSSQASSSGMSPYFRDKKNAHTEKSSNVRRGNMENSENSANCWLTTRKDDDSDDKKQPVKRNYVSLEDTCDGIKGGYILGSKEETPGTSPTPRSVYINKMKSLKRRTSLSEEVPNKKTDQAVNNQSADSDHKSNENLVECPICRVYFESGDIVRHSSQCSAFVDNDTDIIQEVTCPMCSKQISAAVADIHANKCASEMFGD